MPEALWISLSPRLKRFDWRLLTALQPDMPLACWEYHQSLDEPCAWDAALSLLADYLQTIPHPVHLLGHGISGVLALRYARQAPQQVRSLVLLSLGQQPWVTWHLHYYALRQCLPCRRPLILAQMVRFLFGPQGYGMTQALVKVLAAELDSGFAPIPAIAPLPPTALESQGVNVPIWLGLGGQDLLLSPLPQAAQLSWLKPQDRLWHCPEGRHYFHYEYPQQVAHAIRDFWQTLNTSDRIATLAVSRSSVIAPPAASGN